MIEKKKLKNKPVVLVIADGWGIAPAGPGNAIARAKTPNFDSMIKEFPTATLLSYGDAVGIKWGEMGNSEVGHLNIGAGFVFYQNLPRINKEISSGNFFKNETLIEGMRNVKEKKSKLHIMGILSSGGIHGHIDHIIALLKLAKQQKVEDVYLHVILDGRDAVKNSGKVFIKEILEQANEIKISLHIASICGRYYAMDRDNNWDRIGLAYNAIVYGVSDIVTKDDPADYIAKQYDNKIYDEEMSPVVFMKRSKPIATVEEGDTLIFSNFRSDRARQITKALSVPGYEKFKGIKQFKDLYFITMTQYEKDLPVHVVYKPIIITNPLAKVISDAGLNQFHIAETQKYAHVTFFLNGGKEVPFPNEDRKIIPSLKVSSDDEKPEMKAKEITKEVIKAIIGDKYDFIVLNFANADMIGHTGNLKATIKACEVIDISLGKILSEVLAKDGILFFTSDHGNAESLQNIRTQDIDKEHSTNPVPFIMASNDLRGKNLGLNDIVGGDLSVLQPSGILADIAPTILKKMGLNIPDEMTGKSLI